MKKELIASLHRAFEEAVHVEDGVEFWLARELQGLLGYTKWQRFEGVVVDAMRASAPEGGSKIILPAPLKLSAWARAPPAASTTSP